MRNPTLRDALRAGAASLGQLVLLILLVAGAVPLARAAEIAIVQPASEQTIHSNAGDVRVAVQVSGAVAGSRVRLIVDGAVVPGDGNGAAITLHGLDRGTHVIRAELLGADGAVLAASQPVTFHLWQASRLFRHRAP